MSDAIEMVRAIDAISLCLADRMSLALRGHPTLNIDRAGPRWVLYAVAGIDRDDYADGEWIDADRAAISSELSRRLTE